MRRPFQSLAGQIPEREGVAPPPRRPFPNSAGGYKYEIQFLLFDNQLKITQKEMKLKRNEAMTFVE